MPQSLYLIKHARPEVNPSQLPELWKLSQEGIDASNRAASVLQHAGIGNVYSSEEVKAIETAKILADEWKLAYHTRPDLHEHDRSNVPHMRSGEFISHVELFFRRPDELVLGKETATEALERFGTAVRAIVKESSNGSIAVVAHGTVIALLLAKLQEKPNGFDIWRAMQLPSYARIELPSWKVLEIRNRIDNA
jgi:broad specificity phosphatase PhoE